MSFIIREPEGEKFKKENNKAYVKHTKSKALFELIMKHEDDYKTILNIAKTVINPKDARKVSYLRKRDKLANRLLIKLYPVEYKELLKVIQTDINPEHGVTYKYIATCKKSTYKHMNKYFKTAKGKEASRRASKLKYYRAKYVVTTLAYSLFRGVITCN